jgi:hypothetical protein
MKQTFNGRLFLEGLDDCGIKRKLCTNKACNLRCFVSCSCFDLQDSR